MKFKNRNIGLILIIVLTISLLSACTPKTSEPVADEILLQNAGFTVMKKVENDKNLFEIGNNGSTISLEVRDKDVYDSIEENEFYIYTYNSENILKSLSKNDTIKGPVINSMGQGNEPITNEISPVDKVSVEGLTLLDEYEFDFNGDNIMEKINMYTAAERAENGEIMWDDGQRWLFVVHGGDKDYVLFDDYVQLGVINSYVYTIDQNFYITTLSSGTANLTLKSYLYSSSDDMFLETIPFNTDGNVNMLHSSGDY